MANRRVLLSYLQLIFEETFRGYPSFCVAPAEQHPVAAAQCTNDGKRRLSQPSKRKTVMQQFKDKLKINN